MGASGAHSYGAASESVRFVQRIGNESASVCWIVQTDQTNDRSWACCDGFVFSVVRGCVRIVGRYEVFIDDHAIDEDFIRPTRGHDAVRLVEEEGPP